MNRLKHTVLLNGGLGNQLFQYCFALELKRELGVSVTFDLSSYKNQPIHETPRTFALALTGLNVEENYRSFLEMRLKFQKIVISRSLEGRMPLETFKTRAMLFFSMIGNLTIVHTGIPNKFWRLKIFYPLRHYYIGNWQEWKFFFAHQDQIRAALSPTREKLRLKSGLPEKISADDAVVIHVRRGDYATNYATKNFHGLLGREYFTTALKYLLQGTPISKAFVFSDDIEWCKENLKLPIETHFVSGSEDTKTDIDELLLMSFGCNFIISNSTYS